MTKHFPQFLEQYELSMFINLLILNVNYFISSKKLSLYSFFFATYMTVLLLEVTKHNCLLVSQCFFSSLLIPIIVASTASSCKYDLLKLIV